MKEKDKKQAELDDVIREETRRGRRPIDIEERRRQAQLKRPSNVPSYHDRTGIPGGYACFRAPRRLAAVESGVDDSGVLFANLSRNAAEPRAVLFSLSQTVWQDAVPQSW
jgi:hypothetical protein